MIGHGEVVNPWVKQKIREMLAEDLGFGDMTTDALVDPALMVRAKIVCKQMGVLAGVQEATVAFEEVGVKVLKTKREGESLKPNDTVMVLSGPAHAILKAERVGLNLLMRMSGVATATRAMKEAVRRAGAPGVRIAATRKTIPLLGYFDKRAVVVGGGDPHRFRLDDCILIKDDHIRIVGSVRRAVEKAKKCGFSKKIEIEVTGVEQALEAAKAGADIIMLDNVPASEAKQAIRRLEEEGLRQKILVEVSGGITPDNVGDYAKCGADVLSSSYMTLKAPAIDMNLEMKSALRK